MSHILTTLLLLICCSVSAAAENYEFKETKNLVTLVNNAAELVKSKGESAFSELAKL